MIPSWHPAAKIRDDIEHAVIIESMQAAMNRAWLETAPPEFIIGTVANMAMVSEFAKFGHCRKTTATLKGIWEAERLLGLQYRRHA